MTMYYPPTSNFIQKTLGAQLLTGTTASATLNNATAIQNKAGVMIIDRVDANGVETPSKVETISFTGTSGSTVTTLVRGLAGTTDQDHAVGAIVEFGPDIVWAQGIIDTLLNFVTSGGALDTTKVVDLTTAQALTNKTLTDASNVLPVTLTNTATLTNKTLTSPKIVTSIDDSNGNEIIKTPATPSAVNEITVTNAATGTHPVVSATGGDTDIHLDLRGKGNGLVKISVLRQNKTTNVYRNNQVILTGWSELEYENATYTTQVDVTFGITFAEVPIFFTQPIYNNFNASSSGDNLADNTGTNFSLGVALTVYLFAPTVNGWSARMHATSGITSGKYYKYCWMAIGTLA